MCAYGYLCRCMHMRARLPAHVYLRNCWRMRFFVLAFATDQAIKQAMSVICHAINSIKTIK